MTLGTIISQLASGLLKSTAIFALTLLGSLPLGLLVAFGRMSGWAPFRGLARENGGRLRQWLSELKPVQVIVKFYISIMRGTPLMLQLMVVYFGPFYLLGISLGQNYRFYAVIIGFVLNYAAYFAEIYRSGIESMPIGQYEAATVLGYTKAQTFIKIILPQVIKRILPSVTNEVITLVKDTSLAFAISYSEMFTIAKKIASSQATLMPFVVAGVFYYIFNFIVAWIMERCENSLNYFR
ncbi:MAG TPA: polar amino acid ABC transporter permease [Clostridiales bacterium]|nr:polar amino acid ABC transporter permease [Clostridiales bacterium]